MKRNLILVAIFLLGFVVSAAAASATNFTGTWKFDRAKSDASPTDTPKKMSLKIHQSGAKMSVWYSITDNLGDHDWGSNYTLDGKANHNSWDGIEVKSSQEWNGDSLVFNVKRGANSQYKETWSLSPDGKTLTISRHTIFAHSDLTETFAFDRQ
jgi:hypothetical protein